MQLKNGNAEFIVQVRNNGRKIIYTVMVYHHCPSEKKLNTARIITYFFLVHTNHYVRHLGELLFHGKYCIIDSNPPF